MPQTLMELLDTLSGRQGFGQRINGTPKGAGYFGALLNPAGDYSTELSFGFNSGGKEVLAPLMVPTLNAAELAHLLSGSEPTDDIYGKAQQHALERMRIGRSPFALPNEVYPLPK